MTRYTALSYSISELKSIAASKNLSPDYVRSFGKLTVKQTWVDALNCEQEREETKDISVSDIDADNARYEAILGQQPTKDVQQQAQSELNTYVSEQAEEVAPEVSEDNLEFYNDSERAELLNDRYMGTLVIPSEVSEPTPANNVVSITPADTLNQVLTKLDYTKKHVRYSVYSLIKDGVEVFSGSVGEIWKHLRKAHEQAFTYVLACVDRSKPPVPRRIQRRANKFWRELAAA